MAERNLTDADVAAIVEKLKGELVADFYGEVGKGVWDWAKRLFLGLLLILAVYGMAGDKTLLHSIANGTGK